MGELAIFYIILGLLIVVGHFFLYKNPEKNILFILNLALALIICSLSFTSFPTNYTFQRMLALGLGSLAIIAIIPKFINKKNILLSNILLSISIIGGAVHLLV